jgi:tRNA_anti-like
MVREVTEASAKSSKLKSGCLWVGGVLFALFVIGNIFGGGQQKPQSSNSGSTDMPEVVEKPAQLLVTAGELFKAFEDNEVAAKAKYGNKLLVISGTVSDITLDFLDKPVVSLRTPNPFMSLQASGLDADSAGALKKGTKVTLVCSEISEVVGTPMASECSLR